MPGNLYAGLTFQEIETTYEVIGLEKTEDIDVLIIESRTEGVSIAYREYYVRSLGSVKYWPEGDSSNFAGIVRVNNADSARATEDISKEKEKEIALDPDVQQYAALPENPIPIAEYIEMQKITQKRFESGLVSCVRR